MSEKDLQEITKTYEVVLKKLFESEKQKLTKYGWKFVSSEEKDGKIIAKYLVSPEILRKTKQKEVIENVGGLALAGLIIYGIFSYFFSGEPPKPFSKDETVEIMSQFSVADGFHYGLMNKIVSTRMHNPKSFKHIKTTYVVNRNAENYPETLTVTMVYQGTDDFNQPYVSTVTANIDMDGNIIEIVEQK